MWSYLQHMHLHLIRCPKPTHALSDMEERLLTNRETQSQPCFILSLTPWVAREMGMKVEREVKKWMARVRDKHSCTWTGWNERAGNLLWWGGTASNRKGIMAKHFTLVEIDLTLRLFPPCPCRIIHVKINFETVFQNTCCRVRFQQFKWEHWIPYASNHEYIIVCEFTAPGKYWMTKSVSFEYKSLVFEHI